MVESLHIEILTDWHEAIPLEHEWNELWARSAVRTPFHTFEWQSCWYRAFCEPEGLRLIVVRDDECLRAILPGMLCKRRLGGLSLNSFCYAGTGQTPQCGVLAGTGDAAAVKAALGAVTQVSDGPIDLAVLPDVEVASPTWSALTDRFSPHFFVYPENAYRAPCYQLPGGWEGYLASKSKKFRKRLRESVDAGKAFGPMALEVFEAGRDLAEGVRRLQSFDARTWQGQIHRGILPDDAHRNFYRNLGEVTPDRLHFLICILTLGGRDAAYTTAAYTGRSAFLLKTGYDIAFEDARPGVLVRALVTERLAERGLSEFDLGADESEEKRRWENSGRQYESFWLVNRETVKGRVLYAELKAHRLLKSLRKEHDGDTATVVEAPSTAKEIGIS